jgi:hypothetical protein
MPLHIADDIVTLVGVVTVEEAEPLATWLREHPGGGVHLGACTHLHTAALQALLAARPPIDTAPADDFLSRWVLPWLTHHHNDRSEGTP